MNNFNNNHIINMKNDFRDYAVKHLGMNGLALDQYNSAVSNAITSSYISPTIIVPTVICSVSSLQCPCIGKKFSSAKELS